MRMMDMTPFFRSTIGFDRMLDALENSHVDQADSFPPYDIEKLGEDRYRLTLAVAGFSDNDLEIVAQDNVLTVSGRRPDDRRTEYLHHGIPARGFDRRFDLADFVEVKGATLADGLLSIDLAREVPEEMKPHRIAIESGATHKNPDQQAA